MSIMTRPAALSGGVGRRDQPTPYRPLRDFRIEEARKVPTIAPSRWPDVRGWLSHLELPRPVTEAAADVDRVLADRFEPTPEVAALGAQAPSILREARQTWEGSHTTRTHRALGDLAGVLRTHATDLHEQCKAGFLQALDHRDEAGCSAWLRAAIRVRGFDAQRLVGVGHGVRRQELNAASELWKLGNPIAWHEAGRPTLDVASMAASRDDWGVGLYTPQEVHDHLLQLGHRCRCCER